MAQASLPVPLDTTSGTPGLLPVLVIVSNPLAAADAIFGFYRQPSDIDSVAQYTPGVAMLSPGLAIAAEALSYFALSPGRHELLGSRLTSSLAVARWYASVPALADGWGLYGLDIARERGAFEDSVAAYGALMLEMIAAVRLTVDSGIHYFGWTEEQSVEFIMRRTMLDRTESMNEVGRIAHDAPGVGLAAGMGVREIRGVRRWMERELKKDFEVHRFNQELRSLGPVPLHALGPHFEWWLYKERTRLRDAADSVKARRPTGMP